MTEEEHFKELKRIESEKGLNPYDTFALNILLGVKYTGMTYEKFWKALKKR